MVLDITVVGGTIEIDVEGDQEVEVAVKGDHPLTITENTIVVIGEDITTMIEG